MTSTLVYIRYLDHVLFKDVDPRAFEPFKRETIGWLDHESSDYIRVVWERMVDNAEDPKIRQRATGLVILKSDILEIRNLGERVFNKIINDIRGEYGKEKVGDRSYKVNAGDAGTSPKLWAEGRNLQRCGQPLAGRGGET